MRIGIDIDGVLNNQYEFCIHYGSKYCNEIGKYELININALNTTDMFGWDIDEAHRFWNKYRKDLVTLLPPKIFAPDIIHKLKEDGHEIFIITARKNNDEWCPIELANYRLYTEKWLQENGIYYDHLCFNVQNKGEFCKIKKIDYMIEDDPKNLINLQGNTNIIIYDAPYNRQHMFKSCIRAYSWNDIYIKFQKDISKNNH